MNNETIFSETQDDLLFLSSYSGKSNNTLTKEHNNIKDTIQSILNSPVDDKNLSFDLSGNEYGQKDIKTLA